MRPAGARAHTLRTSKESTVHIILSLAQSAPRSGVDVVNVVVIALVLGAVALVFWASRPSVISRYSVDREKQADAAQAPPAPSASPARERDV